MKDRDAVVDAGTGAVAWRPRIGACPRANGVSFRVWAPTTASVELVLEPPHRPAERRRLVPEPGGMFAATFTDVGPGCRYRYHLDGDGPFPDPASRCQPDGVHGSSVVVDATGFDWSDQHWTGVPLAELVVYELHVGTFSPAGTFAGVIGRLPDLRDLGITAIELMPVAAFPGSRNWGYDGAAIFAPAPAYGAPDDLRRLVDAAHRLGLAVLLDVVYNHMGPDGAYVFRYSPYYFTDRHASPWGAGLDLDGEHSAPVREFFIENALHWVHEYHMDGLRLDATHAIHDDSARHFLAELSARVHASVHGRDVHVIAEDHRNLAVMVTPERDGGWGLDAVWADDFHHEMRRLLAGDRDGYYRDFSGTTADLAATIRQGWFFTGQYSTHLGAARGTSPASIPRTRFVTCLQNHDQVGNRALGERLHHQVDPAAFRAASVVLLTAPETPLVFMGQEWAASAPFLYFTDHHEELGRMVTEGRRREFRDFAAFHDDAAAARIPDPQAIETFIASRLDWTERGREPHQSMLRLYGALLTLRRRALVRSAEARSRFRVEAVDDATLAMRQTTDSGGRLLVVARFRGEGTVRLRTDGPTIAEGGPWTRLLASEDPAFSPTPAPPDVDSSGPDLVIRFHGPAAVVLEAAATRADALARRGL